MKPLVDHLLQRFGGNIAELSMMMHLDDTALHDHMRTLSLYYGSRSVQFHGFSVHGIEKERYNKEGPATVKQVYEARHGEELYYNHMPCVVHIVNFTHIRKYPVELLTVE